MALTVHDWMIERDSSPEPPPFEPPSANSLSIPDEAYGASTSYAIDPTLPLGPNDWDEVDRANAARVDELNNEFIDLRNGILHDGDDAFFKQTGRDAILAAPEVHAKLEAARQETLGRAANDVQRQWLDETLGKHKIVEHFDIGDHVGRQSVEWQKSINRGRLDRLNRQAGIEHADPKMVEALANASESSARDHARTSGHRPDSPEAQAEVDSARLSVFRHAIEASLAKNQPRAALTLYKKAKVPHDGQLAAQMKDLAIDVEAAEWIARQDEATEATAQAALSASDLSPQGRRRAFQKLQQQIAVNEDARAAKLKDLAAALAAATKELSAAPSSYRRGTLATLAEGYASVDDDKAGTLRALAEQESFLLGYAQSPIAAQQRILDTLPAGADRDFVEQIGAHQAEAFAKDPWAAGTAIYPDVGPAKPVDDPAGRLAQARLIGQHRDGIAVMPFSGDEIAALRKILPTSPPKRQAEVLKEMAVLPPETLAPLAAALAGRNGSDDFQSHSIVGALSFHVDDAPEIADQVLRGARLIQERGDTGKSMTVTTLEWRNTLRARIGGDAPVPPIVRDIIANIYTHNAERAGQGEEINADLLDKAIVTTLGNASRQPEIMLTPYAIAPETLAQGPRAWRSASAPIPHAEFQIELPPSAPPPEPPSQPAPERYLGGPTSVFPKPDKAWIDWLKDVDDYYRYREALKKFQEWYRDWSRPHLPVPVDPRVLWRQQQEERKRKEAEAEERKKMGVSEPPPPKDIEVPSEEEWPWDIVDRRDGANQAPARESLDLRKNAPSQQLANYIPPLPPANENRTAEDLCELAYAISIAQLRWLHLTREEFLKWREDSTESRNFCLKKALDGRFGRNGVFIEFPGGGVIIFRTGRLPIYRAPQTR